MKKFLEKLKNKQDLSFNESKAAFEILMEGKASDDEIFDFLTLLSSKGLCGYLWNGRRWYEYIKYINSFGFIIG